MSRIIRWVATVIFTILGLPFLVANFQKLLAAKHWDEFLLNLWPSMPDLSYLIQAKWVWVVLVFSGGVGTAMWVIKLLPEKKKSASQWEKIPLRDVAQNLYDELVVSNMANGFRRMFIDTSYPPNKSHEQILNTLANYIANENIAIYGKPPFSTKLTKIDNLQQRLSSMCFRNGAISMSLLGSDNSEFTGLLINKEQAEKVIKNVMTKMQTILIPRKDDSLITDTSSPVQMASLSKLEIIHATYGTQKNSLDVTDELKRLIINNRLTIIASNEIKGDPDFGTIKYLTINYKHDGITSQITVMEGESVTIP